MLSLRRVGERGERSAETNTTEGSAMSAPALDALYFLDARGNVIMSRTYREDIG